MNRSSRKHRPAVFIDEDSVLLPCSADAPEAEPRLHPGALPAMTALVAHGYSLVLLCSHAGDRLAGWSAGELTRQQRRLLLTIEREAETAVTDVLACPHLPGPEGKPTCRCRLPRPGLLFEAAKRHRLALKRCWLIGDGKRARRAARRAGCRSMVVGDGRHADVGDFMGAVRKILRKQDPVHGMAVS